MTAALSVTDFIPTTKVTLEWDEGSRLSQSDSRLWGYTCAALVYRMPSTQILLIAVTYSCA